MPDAVARVYVSVWALACLVALVLAVTGRRSIRLFSRAYWRWLGVPWKLATFALATVGMLALTPVSGDPTWDYVDASVQPLLTFTTAPWALGVLVRAIGRRERPSPREVYVAACVWMVSASWFYDAWIWFSRGSYPSAWGSNIVASSVLYLLGGLLWSLQDREPGSATLGFLLQEWFEAPATYRRVRWLILIVMVFTTALMSPFLWNAWVALSH